MSKKEIDLIREFVEIGFNEIKEETRYSNDVISYTKLKELIVNNPSYKSVKDDLKFTDGNDNNGDLKSNINKAYDDYEKKVKTLKDELQGDETSTTNSSNSTSEDFLKAAIVLSSIAFNIILIKLYLDGDFRLLQLLGGIVIIIALTDASYRIINLLNYSVKNGNENADLHKSALNKLKKIAKSGNSKTVFEFLKIYFEIEATSKNSHVKSKQVLEHFLRKQENFMLKKENIGVPNKKYVQRFDKFYDFMRNTDMTKELIHKYGKKETDNDYTRKHLFQTFDKNEMTETFKELYNGASGLKIENAQLTDDSKEDSKSGDYTDEYYDNLFKEGNSAIFYATIKELCDGLIDDKFKPESDYTSIFASIIKINNAFEILRLANLPEYEEVCDNYFFKGLSEFKKVLSEKDRYMIPDEYKTLLKLKTHLSNCDAYKKGYIKDICEETNKNKDLNLTERVIKTTKAILSKITDDSKFLEVLVENVMNFNHKAKTEVILKKDLVDGKYEEIIDLYNRVFKKVFQHSGVIRIDMASYFIDRADKDYAKEENNGKNLFKHNGRKIIDIIFDELDRSDEDLKIINTTPETQDKFKYITYDQYLQKMVSYDDDALKKMHDNFDMIHKDMENIIIGFRSGKTKDDSSSVKINILKDMVHYYIAGSIFFMLDYFISLFVDAYTDKKNQDFRKALREMKDNSIRSARETAMTKTDKLKNTNFKEKFSGVGNSISSLKEKALNNIRTPKKTKIERKNWKKLSDTVKRGQSGGVVNFLEEGAKTLSSNVPNVFDALNSSQNSSQDPPQDPPKDPHHVEGEKEAGEAYSYAAKIDDKENEIDILKDTIKDTKAKIKKTEREKSDSCKIDPTTQAKKNENECNTNKAELESSKQELKDLTDDLKKAEKELKKFKDEFAKEKSKTYVNGMKFMTVFSIWILSVVLFYSFWMKSDSDYSYNEMIAINNSLKMRDTLERMKKHSKEAYVDKRNRPEHLRLLYEATKDLLVVQGKCNLTKQNQGVIFPTSDVFIGVTIIGICVMVILTNNMLNNPFEVMKKVKMIKQIMANEEEIKKEINVKEDINGVIFDSLKVKEDFLKLLLKTTDDYERVQKDLEAIKSLKAKYYSDLTLNESKSNIKRKQPTILERMSPYDNELTKLRGTYESLIKNTDKIVITKPMYYNIIKNNPEDWFNENNGLKDRFDTITYTSDSSRSVLFDEQKEILLKFLQDKGYNEVFKWVKHYMTNKPTNTEGISSFDIIEQTINESEDPTIQKESSQVTVYEYPNYTTVVKAPERKKRTQFLTDDHKKTALNILNMDPINSVTEMSTNDFIKLREDASLEFDKKIMPYIREAVKIKNDELNRYIRELDNEVIIPYTTMNFTERKTFAEQEKKVNVDYNATGGYRGGSTVLSTGNNLNSGNNAMNNSAMNIDLDNIMKQYDTSEANETLDQLMGLEMSLIDMEKIEPIVNTSVSFSIFMLAIFMSYKIMNNAIKYKVELFNGKLFGESICM